MTESHPRKLTVVLGVHRSGTSVITRALPVLGIALGSRMMQPSASENPTGYWEDLDLYDLDRAMLGALQREWHALAPISERQIDSLRQAEFEQRALAWLRARCGAHAHFACKDPRLAQLLPFWKPLFAREGLDTRYVVVLRNPHSVAASLHLRNGFDERMASLLWSGSTATILQQLIDERFVVIDYDRMIAQPRVEIERLAAALDAGIDESQFVAYEQAFLDHSLHHHRHAADEVDDGVRFPPPTGDMHRTLAALASTPACAELSAGLRSDFARWAAELQAEAAARGLIDHLMVQLEAARKQAQRDVAARRELQDHIRRSDAALESLHAVLAAQESAAATLSAERERLVAAMAAQEQAMSTLREAIARERDTWCVLQQRLNEAETHIREQYGRIAEMTEDAVQQDERVLKLDAELSAERATVAQLRASTSWRITRPLRAAKNLALELRALLRIDAPGVDRWQMPRRLYHALPLRHESRERFKTGMYARFPHLFATLPSYRLWLARERELARLSAPREPSPGSGTVAAGPVQTEFHFPYQDDPVVSIIVPVHGKLDYSLRCLASIERNCPAVPFELIVVDDCSPDDTALVLAGCSGVVLLGNTSNLGFIRSCNRGAAIARGEFLCFLNNDCEVHQHWLDELLETFERFPRAGMAGSKLLFPDGRLQEAGGILWSDGSAWNFGRGQDAPAPQFNYAREVDYCSGASLMIRRELFRRLGGFDDAYAPAYGEDSDLALKVRAEGLAVIYQPQSVVVHHEGVSCGTDPVQGIKRFQPINARKLHARWSAEFARQQAPGCDVDQAKDRGIRGRALVLDHCTPTPDRDAGSVTALNLMLLLRQSGLQVTFVPEDNFLYMPEYTPLLQRAGIEVLYAPQVRSVREHLAESGRRYDLVLLFRPAVAERHLDALRAQCPGVPVIYHASDLHFLRLAREAEIAGTSREAALDMRRRELAQMRGVDCVIVHSSTERELLVPLLGSVPVHVFQWAIPVRGTTSGFARRRDIAFVGGYQHGPNVDAVQHFVADILPHVRAELPDARFRAIGSDPSQALRCLQSDAVDVTGFVEDLGSVLDEVRVAVAPLRIGAGIKGKIATTLSVGLPCVATTIAVEGMGLEDGAQVLVADDPQHFAQQVIALYRDEMLWQSLSQNGLDFAQRAYGAGAAEQSIRAILASVGLAAPEESFVHTLASPLARRPARPIPARRTMAARRNHRLQALAVVADREGMREALTHDSVQVALQAGEGRLPGSNAQEFVVEGWCIPCARTVPFLVDMHSGGRQDPDGRWIPNWRERLECPLCRMNNRQRLAAGVLAQALDGVAHADVYLMEQVTPIHGWARRNLNGHAIIGSEYLGIRCRGGELVRGLRHEDAMALSFADASLDIVLSNDVFEHVPDPWLALRECARVLRPGGTLLFTVPFDAGSDASAQRARPAPEGLRHLLPPVYHGNPVTGEGVLVYWDFGWDLLPALRDAGFAPAQAELYADAALGHLGEPQILFRARRAPQM